MRREALMQFNRVLRVYALALAALTLLLAVAALPVSASGVEVRLQLDYELGVALVKITGRFSSLPLPLNASSVTVKGAEEWSVSDHRILLKGVESEVIVEYALRCEGNVTVPLPEESGVNVFMAAKGLPWGSMAFVDLVKNGESIVSSRALPLNGSAQVAVSCPAQVDEVVAGYITASSFIVRVTTFRVCCPSAGRIRCTVGLEVPEGVEVILPKDLAPEGYKLVVNVTLKGKPRGLATREYVEQYLVPVEKPGRYVAVLEINGTKVRTSSVDVPLLSSGEGTRIMLAASLLGVAVVLVAAAYWRMKRP